MATVNLFLDTRKYTDGTGIVKWSVIHRRTPRLYTTRRRLTAAEWKFLQDNKGRLDNRIKDEEKIRLWREMYGDTYPHPITGEPQTGLLKRAQIVIARLGNNFSFEAFAQAIANFGKQSEQERAQTDLIAALLAKADAMQQANRPGNATAYQLAAKSLRRFVDSFDDTLRRKLLGLAPLSRQAKATGQASGQTVLLFSHLTVAFLNAYEQWMICYGKAPQKPGGQPGPASLTSVGIYLRHVRAIINEALEAGLITREAYPFGRNRYTIPAGANVKKALPKSDIDKLKAYQPLEGTTEQRSQYLWLFSYFCNGMNFADICALTWGNVDLQAERITFVRQKTARTKRQKQTWVVVHLRPEAIATINRWGTRSRKPTDYVFPFFTPEMTGPEKKQAVHQLVKATNKYMKRIAQTLGIAGEVGTYAARHSFATMLLKGNAPLAFISKQLGHTNVRTTESYLGSFDDEETRRYRDAL